MTVSFAVTLLLGALTVSARHPAYFERDGRTFVPVGCNLCFCRGSERMPEEKVLATYDAWLGKFAANGGNYARLWLGDPFFDLTPTSPTNYSAVAARHLREVVRMAETRGILLKLTLEHFRAPEYPSEGAEIGLARFDRRIYLPYAKDIRAYFASDFCRAAYLRRAARYAELIGSSSAGGVIELWNEANVHGGPEILDAWTRQMLVEVKRLFPRQLVVENLGSFSAPQSFEFYDWLVSLKDTAFLQVHRYYDPGAELDICRNPSTDVWAADAVRELRDRDRTRPALLAEAGAVEWNHAGPSKRYAADDEGVILHDILFAPFFAGAAGSGQPWHWDHMYVDGKNLWFHFGRFAKAVAGYDPIVEKARPFATETPALRLYGLRGETTTLVWARVKNDDGAVKKGLHLDICYPKDYTCYLPFEDRTVRVGRDQAEWGCRLPDFRHSVVVRYPTVEAR